MKVNCLKMECKHNYGGDCFCEEITLDLYPNADKPAACICDTTLDNGLQGKEQLDENQQINA